MLLLLLLLLFNHNSLLSRRETLKAGRAERLWCSACNFLVWPNVPYYMSSMQVTCSCHGTPHKDGTATSLRSSSASQRMLLSEEHPVFLHTEVTCNSKTCTGKCPNLLSYVSRPPREGREQPPWFPTTKCLQKHVLLSNPKEHRVNSTRGISPAITWRQIFKET